MKRVEILGTGSYLPGEPITNADVNPENTEQAGQEEQPQAASNVPDSGSAADPKTEEGTL